jgi:hypothetical protein
MTYEESPLPTRFAVLCPEHGRVFLTEAEYMRQLDLSDEHWRCPRFVATPEAIRDKTIGPCGTVCNFDDDLYEESL